MADVEAGDLQRPSRHALRRDVVPQGLRRSRCAPERKHILAAEGTHGVWRARLRPTGIERVEVRFERQDVESQMFVEVADQPGPDAHRSTVAVPGLPQHDYTRITHRAADRTH